MTRMPRGFTHPMRVGRGAFSSVYRARQTALERWVAIKILNERDAVKRHKLLKEARTQAEIRIDCVPQVYDAFEKGGRVYIVMQWIKGVSLAAVLERNPGDEERVWIADGFLRALAKLHGAGFAHRDLKPQNIQISPAGGIYLLDFGFTRGMFDPRESMEGTIKGTPAYMAPELWRGVPDADPVKADVFAAGKILREVLGGSHCVSIVEQMTAEDPVLRPASADSAYDVWETEIAGRLTMPQWGRVAADLASATMAAHLYAGARQLLLDGNEEEAYWLLVECLEENPDYQEALALMSAFAGYAKKHRLRRQWTVAGTVLAVICGIVAAYFIGRRSGRWESLTAAANLRHRDKIVESPGNTGTRMIRSLSVFHLRGDSWKLLKGRRLSATLLFSDLPEEGVLVIDTTEYTDTTAMAGGIELPYGEYLVEWRDTDGVRVWRERIRLLPFQSLALAIKPVGT